MSVIFDQLRLSDDGKKLYINVHVNKLEVCPGGVEVAPGTFEDKARPFANTFDHTFRARKGGSSDAFDKVYIDSITIVTADKVSETDPGVPTSDYIYKRTFKCNKKHVGLVLTAQDFMKTWETDPRAMRFLSSNMSKTLFFVYVKVRGVPGKCTPCALDREYTVGVTFDVALLYQRVMGYTKELANTCEIPQDFADFILLWNAFKAAVETEHWIAAIKYYNMLFEGTTLPSSSNKGCGCHG